MPHVKQLIDGHNQATSENTGIAQPRQDEVKKCNCREKEGYPQDGECLVNEVYPATAKTKEDRKSVV